MNPIFGFIDPTITGGNIIEIAVLAGGGIWSIIKMSNGISLLKSDVSMMQREIVKIGDVLTKLAVTENRLSNIETDIRELRHGNGFIRGNSGIEREYGK